MATIKINCLSCTKTTSGKFSFGVVGLRKYACPECKKVHEFGLSDFTEKLYIGFIALIFAALLAGYVQSLGILFPFIGYALYKNYQVSNSPATAQVATE